VILRPYPKWYGRFLLQNWKNRTKGENRLAIGTKQVQDRLSTPEMVHVLKSLCQAFMAFHCAKAEMSTFTNRDRWE